MKFIITKTLILLCINFLLIQNAVSQEKEVKPAPTTIGESFDQLMSEYGTWDIYKVVPVTRMEQFSKSLTDTMKLKEARIQQLAGKIRNQQVKIDAANEKIAGLNESLEQSESTNDKIAFMGIDFQKSGYHVMMWALVAILFFLAALAYLLFIRSNKLTNQSRKECENLKKELEDQRTKSHENQLKIKRELQTAVNLLTEHGIRT